MMRKLNKIFKYKTSSTFIYVIYSAIYIINPIFPQHVFQKLNSFHIYSLTQTHVQKEKKKILHTFFSLKKKKNKYTNIKKIRETSKLNTYKGKCDTVLKGCGLHVE